MWKVVDDVSSLPGSPQAPPPSTGHIHACSGRRPSRDGNADPTRVDGRRYDAGAFARTTAATVGC